MTTEHTRCELCFKAGELKGIADTEAGWPIQHEATVQVKNRLKTELADERAKHVEWELRQVTIGETYAFEAGQADERTKAEALVAASAKPAAYLAEMVANYPSRYGYLAEELAEWEAALAAYKEANDGR